MRLSRQRIPWKAKIHASDTELPWLWSGIFTLHARLCGRRTPHCKAIARSDVTRLSAFMVAACVAIIRIYQWTIGPLLGPCCRFEPSCSRYTLVCIERWGVLRGGWLGVKRLSRCHPFCPGGHDPPPEIVA